MQRAGRDKMPRVSMTSMALGLAIALVVSPSLAEAVSLINGDFETGDLTGWTTFTTTNGTLGSGFPQVVLFDTANTGTPSNSAAFNVGSFIFGNPAGGGILQNVNLFNGDLSVSADIAVLADFLIGNADGGLFELLLNGVVVDSHNFGFVATGITEFNVLADISGVTAGSYEIAVRITRETGSTINATLIQYIDNVVISGSATVPEPASAALALLALGVVGSAVRRHR